MKRFAALLGLLLVPLQAAAFPDVSAVHESRRAIEYLQQAGVLEGYPDGNFRPSYQINRAEFLKVLVAARGIEPPAQPFGCYPDVTDQWFAPYVCMATIEGWVEGYPDGTFGPEKPVSFAEALKMIVNVRGYPLAPASEIARRGIDPSAWFAPYLTTALLLDVVSFEQVWGEKAMPLQAPLTRAAVAQMLYRSILAEAALNVSLSVADCAILPTGLEVKTFVDVLLPIKTRIFRQELRAVDDASGSCLLAADANPFSRVTATFDEYFLQPYPGGQPTDKWTVRIPLREGRAILRGGKVDGAFRPEVFVADIFAGRLSQLPSVFAAQGGSIETSDGRYIVFIGVTGRTLEAIDLVAGAHVVIDAVEEPFTYQAANDGTQNVSVSAEGANVVTYTLYDATELTTEGGYLVLEVRTADIDLAFSQVESDPFAEPAPPSDDEDPFEDYGETSPFFP